MNLKYKFRLFHLKIEPEKLGFRKFWIIENAPIPKDMIVKLMAASSRHTKIFFAAMPTYEKLEYYLKAEIFSYVKKSTPKNDYLGSTYFFTFAGRPFEATLLEVLTILEKESEFEKIIKDISDSDDSEDSSEL